MWHGHMSPLYEHVLAWGPMIHCLSSLHTSPAELRSLHSRSKLHVQLMQAVCRCNELEICLSLSWDLNPGLSLAQTIGKRTHYQSAKGELAHSQGQQRSFEFEFEGYVTRERCHGNLPQAFTHLTVLTCELARSNPTTLARNGPQESLLCNKKQTIPASIKPSL